MRTLFPDFVREACPTCKSSDIFIDPNGGGMAGVCRACDAVVFRDHDRQAWVRMATYFGSPGAARPARRRARRAAVDGR